MTDRDKLIVDHMGLVTDKAWDIVRKSPSKVEFDDVFQDGCVGLIAAAETWDPAKASFAVWAKTKAFSAMLDGIRQRSWVPRYAIDRQEKLTLQRQWPEQRSSDRVFDPVWCEHDFGQTERDEEREQVRACLDRRYKPYLPILFQHGFIERNVAISEQLAIGYKVDRVNRACYLRRRLIETFDWSRWLFDQAA